MTNLRQPQELAQELFEQELDESLIKAAEVMVIFDQLLEEKS